MWELELAVMNFLHGTTAEEIDGKVALIVLNSRTEIVQTITAEIFLQAGRLMIDCIPVLRRKHIAAVPDDAIITRAVSDKFREKFAVIIAPESEAAKFIYQMVALKLVSLN